mmetsp:Transcript_89645/g.187247  ORF Transcript_89645/g.187247 Transcript_89645/m.187247 type:complete len:80 (-) Transcript_89645:827-1066(-)
MEVEKVGAEGEGQGTLPPGTFARAEQEQEEVQSPEDFRTEDFRDAPGQRKVRTEVVTLPFRSSRVFRTDLSPFGAGSFF